MAQASLAVLACREFGKPAAGMQPVLEVALVSGQVRACVRASARECTLGVGLVAGCCHSVARGVTRKMLSAAV